MKRLSLKRIGNTNWLFSSGICTSYRKQTFWLLFSSSFWIDISVLFYANAYKLSHCLYLGQLQLSFVALIMFNFHLSILYPLLRYSHPILFFTFQFEVYKLSNFLIANPITCLFLLTFYTFIVLKLLLVFYNQFLIWLFC